MVKKNLKRTERSPIVIHEDVKQRLKDHVSGEMQPLTSLLCDLIETDTGPKQMDVIKKINKEIRTTNIWSPEVDISIQALVNIYLNTAVKNPLKRALISCFQSSTQDVQSKIVSVLRDQVLHMIPNMADSLEVTSRRFLVDVINALMENFKLGESCLQLITPRVLGFLSASLQCFYVCASASQSAVLQTEHMHSCLVTVQTISKLIQKCVENVETEIQRGGGDIRKYVENIYKSVRLILKEESFLPDCRGACGMLLPLLLKLCSKDVGTMLLSLAYPKYLAQTPDNLTVFTLPAPQGSLSQGALPLSSYICLCNGVLAMLETTDLVKLYTGNKMLLVDVILVELFNTLKSLKETSNRLLGSRALVMWTHRTCICLANHPDNQILCGQLHGEGHVVQQLLQYLYTHWEDPVDAIKHQARAIFENCIKIHLLASKDDPKSSPFLSDLAKSFLLIDSNSKGHYGPLCCLVEKIGATRMLSLKPTLCEDLLAAIGEQGLACHVSELLEKLLTNHRLELSSCDDDCLEKWQTTWVNPVMRLLCTGTRQQKTGIIEYVLPKLLKTSPESISYMTRNLISDETDNVSIHVGALMTCLKRAKAMGILRFEQTTPGMWAADVPVHTVRQALCHADEQVRLDTYGLLCENHRTTEIISDTDFNLIKVFLPLNMNSQSPSFRQGVVAFTKKLCIRLKDGGLMLHKKVAAGSTKYLEDFEQYKSFLHWLCSMLFSGIHSGASFTRRTVASNILTVLSEIFGARKQANECQFFCLEDCIGPAEIQTLLECFTDTFESNKKEACDILIALTPTGGSLFSDEKIQQLFDCSISLVSSPKPQDSTTAAYLLKLLLHQHNVFSVTITELEKIENVFFQGNDIMHTEISTETLSKETYLSEKLQQLKVTSTSGDCVVENLTHSNASMKSDKNTSKEFMRFDNLTNSWNSRNLLLLHVLIGHLGNQISVAKQSLLHAAATRPLYPVLQCIRYALADTDFKSLSDSKSWRTLLDRLMHLALEVASIVSPVVSNSSPEGNVSEEEGIMGPGLAVDALVNTSEDRQLIEQANKSAETVKLMPEFLVVCCWRSIKEVSLLLGQMVQTVPVMDTDSGSQVGLLSCHQVHVIGDYFKTQLLQSRHRGAFELAYAGFVKMCEMLWRCPIPSLHQLPSQWLQVILDDIGQGDPNLCSTRRSAGVPFYIQAIVTTEPVVGGKPCFKKAMERLLEIGLSGKEVEMKENVPKVHALNILRALFRDSRLGEVVAPYVADGLKAALMGFTSKVWGIRNSATLLFSAMVNRIFGVKRTKEDQSKKNCMTGRIFFYRYPSLFQFILDQLAEATKDVGMTDQLHLHPSLYPILMVLGRLFPSVIEGNDSNLNLAAYIPYVLSCAASPVFKTRIMSARALRPLIFKDQLAVVLRQLLDKLCEDNTPLISQNYMHGILLQVLHLVKDLKEFQSAIIEQIQDVFQQYFPKTRWILARTNQCAVTRGAYLNVISCFLSTYHHDNNDITTEWRTIFDWIVTNVSNEINTDGGQSIGVPGVVEFQTHCADFLLEACNYGIIQRCNHGNIVLKLLQSHHYEVRLRTLEYLQQESNSQIFENTTDSTKHMDIFASLVGMVTSAEHHPDCTAEAFLVIARHPLAQRFPWKVGDKHFTCDQILKMLTATIQLSHRDEVRCAALIFSGVVAREVYTNCKGDHGTSDTDILISWLNELMECTHVEQSVSCRESSAKVVLQSAKWLLFDPNNILGQSVFKSWTCLLTLLQDEDGDVRDIVAMVTREFTSICVNPGDTQPDDLHLVQPTHALDLSVQAMVHCIGWRHPVMFLETMVAWINGGMEGEPVNYDLESVREMEPDRLFDKGELNTYREVVEFARIVAKHLKLWLETAIVNRPQTDVHNKGQPTDTTAESAFRSSGNSVTSQPGNNNFPRYFGGLPNRGQVVADNLTQSLEAECHNLIPQHTLEEKILTTKNSASSLAEKGHELQLAYNDNNSQDRQANDVCSHSNRGDQAIHQVDSRRTLAVQGSQETNHKLNHCIQQTISILLQQLKSKTQQATKMSHKDLFLETLAYQKFTNEVYCLLLCIDCISATQNEAMATEIKTARNDLSKTWQERSQINSLITELLNNDSHS